MTKYVIKSLYESFVLGGKDNQISNCDQPTATNPVRGIDVRNFYESVIAMKPNADKKIAEPSIKVRKRKAAKVTVADERFYYKFLTLARDGDVDSLKEVLKNVDKLDINYSDQYGWTALMCASQTGQADMVQYLINLGVDITKQNNNGQNAYEIGSMFDHVTVCLLLEGNSDGLNDQECEETESFFCDHCQLSFNNTNKLRHETSTIHLFHTKKTLPSTIGKSNSKGYRMMVQSGWRGDQGLGRHQQGKKYPVKTVLKRDRYGFGNQKNVAPKVTHFKANDVEAIKTIRSPPERTIRRICRQEQRRKKHRERKLEVNFRREFYE